MGRQAGASAAEKSPAVAAGEAGIADSKRAAKRGAGVTASRKEEEATTVSRGLTLCHRDSKRPRLQQQQQQLQQRKNHKRQELHVEEKDLLEPEGDITADSEAGKADLSATAPAASAEASAPQKDAVAVAIDAAVAADPYLLEDADYLRSERRWLNRQRTKWEKKEKLQNIAELCQLRSCNAVVYLEQRKNDALLHVTKVPLGPTFIARVMNVETLSELRLSGNCLLHSRPLLVFAAEFDREPQFRVLKELFTQVAPLVVGEGGDANNPHRQTYIEIGPRFVLDPVKILEGSFCGKTLWRNAVFVRTRDLLRPRRLQAALDFARRQEQKERRKVMTLYL
ncbi:ribosome biogenesis protein [Cyclospora cayetanensis]|uniref:Ribosome biogenesis protein n=1 Tax=Cyclospora cayetanensis TaxID=88456 RepID=A0A1D3D9U8_9EIME|nr:ribosome biogenesis protein [Cyclospora cayetanensis]